MERCRYRKLKKLMLLQKFMDVGPADCETSDSTTTSFVPIPVESDWAEDETGVEERMMLNWFRNRPPPDSLNKREDSKPMSTIKME